MPQWPLLSLATFLPLVGAAFVFLTRGDNEEAVARNTRYVALWTSFIVLVVIILIWSTFDAGTAEFQFVERAPWIPAFGIEFHLGHRRNFTVPDRVDGVPRPDLHPLFVGRHQGARQGVHDRLPGHGVLHHRRLLRP